MEKMKTQKERVYDFIAKNGIATTWDLEMWAWSICGKEKMMGGSATRYARSLVTEGKIRHPIEDGIVNRHKYEIVKSPEFTGTLF